jgi:hypothetical protein
MSRAANGSELKRLGRTELVVRALATGRRAQPNLIAVVGVGFGRRRHIVDPTFGNDLLAAGATTIEKQQTDAQPIARGGERNNRTPRGIPPSRSSQTDAVPVPSRDHKRSDKYCA